MANALKYLSDDDFYLLIDSLKQNLETYKKNNLHIRNFCIKLSNGHEIYFNLHKSTIAHLLGIDVDYLYSLGKFKQDKAYDLLEYIIYNPDSLLEMSKKGLLNFGLLFSDNVFEKNMIFDKLFTLDLNNVYFYSPLVTTKELPSNINYEEGKALIAYKIEGENNEEEYRIITLSKKTHGKYRSISSHRYYDDKELFMKDLLFFTENQDISMITDAMCYEKKDENTCEVSISIKDLLENTKRIDELGLPNKVDVKEELKRRYSIKCLALDGIDEVLNSKDEYEMLKKLYKVIINNEGNIVFEDDSKIDEFRK